MQKFLTFRYPVLRVQSIILLLAAILFLESCEGYRCAAGIVMDKTTKLPLDSVLVEVISASKTIYTDSSGKFNVCNGMGGCMPDCKDIVVRFSKRGFVPITLTNPEKEVNVLMEK